MFSGETVERCGLNEGMEMVEVWVKRGRIIPSRMSIPSSSEVRLCVMDLI
jgi:hypothetical protein